MAGFIKQKKYKWQETNLALFGSDLEKKPVHRTAPIPPTTIS